MTNPKPKPWWQIWEEVKNEPCPPHIKPIADYFAAGLRSMSNLPKIPKLKVDKDDQSPS